MRWKSSMAAVLVVVMSASAVGQGTGQPAAPSDWSVVTNLKPGTRLLVRGQGTRLAGRMAGPWSCDVKSADQDSLSCKQMFYTDPLTAGKPMRFERSEVAWASRRTDYFKVGAFIGAGVGIVAGTIGVASGGGVDQPAIDVILIGGLAVFLALIGAVAGLYVDVVRSLFPHKKIYEHP